MSTPTDPTPAPTPSTSATTGLLNQLVNEEPLFKQLIADYKAKGFKGLAADIPQLIVEGEKLVPGFSAAIAEIRAGYKTTEFWLTVGATGVIVGLSAIGKPLPMGVDAVVASLIGVYSLGRAIVKAFSPSK